MTLKTIQLIGKTLFMLIFPLFLAAQSFAQVSNSGKEFYVAFGKNDTVTTVKNLTYLNGEYVVQGNSVDLILRITAIADTEVTLSFTENSALNTTITVAGGEIRDYHLTADQARAAYSGHNINAYNNKKSIRITATEPVNIVAMSTVYASTEATLVWPVETWGTEYYNTGLNIYRTSDYNGYILIAKEDGTTFTHTSPTNSFTHTLNAGELYYAASSNSNNFYYRGAHVVSNKPVAFFNTNTSGRLEFGPNTLRYGYNFEQLLPVNSWGMEFILPTNESIDLNYPYNASEAIYARVFTKEANTNVTVKYTNGTEQNYTIAAAGSSEVITINNTSNSTAKAAYISSDKPVSITAFHTSHDPGPSKEWQPGEAWLSPIEQSTRNVLISPLDFDARLMNLMIHHYFSIIVPTSSKDKTTISIDGGPVQPIQNVLKTSPNQPGFMWIADSIGGSGYSFGRYYFGDSNANENIFLNTTALVDNPDGLLVLAWGQGNYANYFYTAGSAARNLEASLYVNNIHHDIVMGQVFCASNFEFKAIFNDPNYYGSGYPKWFFNNVETQIWQERV